MAIKKLQLDGEVYNLITSNGGSGGGSGGGSTEPIIKTPEITGTGSTITFTEDELAQIQNNLGTVVKVDMGDGEYLPLTPAYSRLSISSMQPQLILCCEIVEYNMWYKFVATDDPLVFAINPTDTSSPFSGGGSSEGGNGVIFESGTVVLYTVNTSQPGSSIDMSITGEDGTLNDEDYNKLLYTALREPDENNIQYSFTADYNYGSDTIARFHHVATNKHWDSAQSRHVYTYYWHAITATGVEYELIINDDKTWTISKRNSGGIYHYNGDLTSVDDFNNVVQNNYTHVYLEDTGYESPWVIVSKGDTSYICEITTGFMKPASTTANGYDGACKTYLRFNYDSSSNTVTYNYYNNYTSTVIANPKSEELNDALSGGALTQLLVNDKVYDIASGGGSGGGSSTTVIHKELSTDYTITFTEEELAQLKSDMGIVVNVFASDEEHTLTIPLSQLYPLTTMDESSTQYVFLYCGILGVDMCFAFLPTEENPLIFELTTMDSPLGGGSVDTSNLATKSELETGLNSKQNKLTVTLNGDGTIDLTIPY